MEVVNKTALIVKHMNTKMEQMDWAFYGFLFERNCLHIMDLQHIGIMLWFKLMECT